MCVFTLSGKLKSKVGPDVSTELSVPQLSHPKHPITSEQPVSSFLLLLLHICFTADEHKKNIETHAT